MDPDHPGCRVFVTGHLQDVHETFHLVGEAGGTFSAKKTFICVPEVETLGSRCAYEGRFPDNSTVQKIIDWP
ncbi:hypothetical protein SISSUDRAFT_994985, partial [Sistotremastrum suecicum HHB10207 ss-3]